MRTFLKRLGAWTAITSMVAIGLGGVVAQAETQLEPKIALSFSGQSVSVSESAGTASVRFTWSGGTKSEFRNVQFTLTQGSASSGSDFGAITSSTPTTLEGASGSKTVTVNIVNDNVRESTESFRVYLKTYSTSFLFTPQTLATSTVSISDDDTFATEFVGSAGLTTSNQDLLNAYQLLIMSQDVYATDEEKALDDGGAADWPRRFTDRWEGPDFGWDVVATYDNAAQDTQAVALKNSSAYVIAFRGTQQMADWATDANTFTTGVTFGKKTVYIHSGFWNALNAVYASIQADMVRNRGTLPVWITGHSLGGALAELMAFRIKTSSDASVSSIPVKIVTFGGPSIGSTNFDAKFQSSVSSANFQRWVNAADPVPMVPGQIVAGFDHNTKANVMRESDTGDITLELNQDQPNLIDEGADFDQHSLSEYHRRLSTLITKQMNLTNTQASLILPEFLTDTTQTEPPPPEDAETAWPAPDFSTVVMATMLVLFSGYVVAGIGIAAVLLIVAELLLNLDYAYTVIASALESIYHASVEAIAETLNYLGATVDEIFEAIGQFAEVTAQVATEILLGIGQSIEEIADYLVTNFSAAYDEVVSILVAAGESVSDIANMLVSVFNATVDEVAQWMHDAGIAINDVAEALYDAFWETYETIASALKDAGFAVQQVANALIATIGATFEDITSWLSDALGYVNDQIATFLKNIGATASDIANALYYVLDISASQIAIALKAAGYAINAVANAIKSAFEWTSTQMTNLARALKDAWGTAYDSIAGALKATFGSLANAIATSLKTIGASVNAVATALKTAFSWTVANINSLATALKTAWGSSWNTIATGLKAAFGAVSDAIAVALKAAGATVTAVATALKTAFSWTVANINSLATALKAAWGTAWSTIASGLSTAYGAVATQITGALKAIGAGISQIGSALKSVAISILDIAMAIVDWFTMSLSALVDLLKAIGASAADAASIAWNALFG